MNEKNILLYFTANLFRNFKYRNVLSTFNSPFIIFQWNQFFAIYLKYELMQFIQYKNREGNFVFVFLLPF